jgi:hypothetical protein
MWVQAASNQDDAAPEQTTNGHVAVATKQERHTARRAASQVPAEAA